MSNQLSMSMDMLSGIALATQVIATKGWNAESAADVACFSVAGIFISHKIRDIAKTEVTVQIPPPSSGASEKK